MFKRVRLLGMEEAGTISAEAGTISAGADRGWGCVTGAGGFS